MTAIDSADDRTQSEMMQLENPNALKSSRPDMVKQRFWDDWINPITIRELRRSMRNFTVLGTLILFLIVQLLIMGGICLFSQAVSDYEKLSLGITAFYNLSFLLQFTICCLIPAYGGINMALDRFQQSSDLLFSTQLSPRQIVWGKFCNGALLIFLTLSACAPFLTLTYQLRGIDLQVVFAILSIGTVLALCHLQAGLLLGSLPIGIFLRILVGLAGMAAFIGIMFSFVGMTHRSLVRRGFTYSIFSSWGEFIPYIAIILLLCLIWNGCFSANVALLATPTMNRALPLRRTLMILWLLTLLLFLGMTFATGAGIESFFVWANGWTAIWSFGFLVAISGRRELSLRIRREIPRSGWQRRLAFLFYSGVAWLILMSSLTLLINVLAVIWLLQPSYRTRSDIMLQFWLPNLVILFHASTYSLLSLRICLRTPRLRRYPWLTGLVALGLMVLVTFASLVLYFLSHELQISDYMLIFSPAVLICDYADPKILSAGVMLLWSLFLISTLLPFFYEQMRNFISLQEFLQDQHTPTVSPATSTAPLTNSENAGPLPAPNVLDAHLVKQEAEITFSEQS